MPVLKLLFHTPEMTRRTWQFAVRMISTVALIQSWCPVARAEVATLPTQTTEEFVLSQYSEFEWWIDPDSKLVNFRRCDHTPDGNWRCRAPMLLRGIELKEIPILLDYYAERLAQSGNSRLNQFIKVLTGSFGTATAYIGAITTWSVLKSAFPSRLSAVFTSPVRSGIHIVSLGTLGLLLYFTADNFIHLFAYMYKDRTRDHWICRCFCREYTRYG